MNKKTDIEKLARQAFASDEIQPPQGTFEAIQSRMGVLRRRKRAAVASIIVGSAIVLGGLGLFMIPTEEKTAATNGEEAVQAAPVMMAESAATPIAETESAQTRPSEPKTEQQAEQQAKPSAQPAANAGEAPVLKASDQMLPVPKDVEPAPVRAKKQETESASSQNRPAEKTATPPSPRTPAPVQATAPQADTPKKTDTKIQPLAEEHHLPMVEPPMHMGNVFTPNGDGYQDCWEIPGIETYDQVELQVFTAKSKRVFFSNHYNNDFCGQNLPAGNYFYIITFHKGNLRPCTKRGALVIVR